MMTKYNYNLIKRQRYLLSSKYGLIIIAILLGIVVFAAYVLIPGNNFEQNLEDYSSGLNLMIWGLIGIKLMFQIFWKSNELNINLNSLVFFPISSGNKYLYLVFQKIFSISSFYLIIFFSIISISLIIENFSAGLVTAISFFIYVIMIDVWVTDINLLFGRIFIKSKYLHLLILFFFLIIPISLKNTGIISEEMFLNISRVPVFNWPGKVVYSTFSGEWLTAGLNLLYITVFSIIGITFGLFLLRKIRYH